MIDKGGIVRVELVNFFKVSLILVSIFIVGHFIWLSLYANPAADDFCYAVSGRDGSFLNTQKFWYTYQNGRYFSTMLLSINPVRYDSLFAYKLIPVILLIGYFLSVLFFIKTFLKGEMGVSTLVAIAVFFMAVYFAFIENVSQSIYWISGSMTYQVPIILLVIFSALLINYFEADKRSFKTCVILVFISFAIVGSHELPMLLLNALIWGALILNYVYNKKLDKGLLVVGFFTLLFSLLVYFSPGNSVRQSQVVSDLTLFDAVKNAVNYGFEMMGKWLLQGHLLVSVGLVLFVNLYVHKIKSTYFLILPMWIQATLIISLVIFMALPTFLVLGCPPPLRTADFIYFTFVFLWYYFSVGVSVRAHNMIKKSTEGLVRGFYRGVLSAALLLVVIFIINFKNTSLNLVTSDLYSGKARLFDIEYAKRVRMIKQANGDFYKVDQLRHKPESLYIFDIDFDDYEYQNPCYSQVFNKKTITWY